MLSPLKNNNAEYDFGNAEDLDTIKIYSQNGTTASLYYVEVDGRLLVDNGVWNISKNWSSYAANSDSTYPTSQLFNTGFGGDGSKNAVDLKQGTITFDPPLTYSSSLVFMPMAVIWHLTSTVLET